MWETHAQAEIAAVVFCKEAMFPHQTIGIGRQEDGGAGLLIEPRLLEELPSGISLGSRVEGGRTALDIP